MMALVADGLTNDETARKLYMSPATVRTHVSQAMTKLGVRDRAQLVVLALRNGTGAPQLARLTHPAEQERMRERT
jgi:DNA-binding CsgD family transcriptional regulator